MKLAGARTRWMQARGFPTKESSCQHQLLSTAISLSNVNPAAAATVASKCGSTRPASFLHAPWGPALPCNSSAPPNTFWLDATVAPTDLTTSLLHACGATPQGIGVRNLRRQTSIDGTWSNECAGANGTIPGCTTLGSYRKSVTWARWQCLPVAPAAIGRFRRRGASLAVDLRLRASGCC